MNKTVLIPTDIAAKNIDSLNRSVVADVNVDNGAVFYLDGVSTEAGQGEVFKYAEPNADNLGNLWMAYSPEVVVTVDGDFQAKGIDANPAHFTNLAGVPFDAFKLQVGDLVQMTKEGFTNDYSVSTPYAVATAGSNKLTWSANAIEGVTFKFVKAQPIIIGAGVIGNNANDAYIIECVGIN